MNIERLTRLRDYLRSLPETKFNMSTWFNAQHPQSPTHFCTVIWVLKELRITNANTQRGCGTTACMAGHALALFAPDEIVSLFPGQRAGELLDLTFDQWDSLFRPYRHVLVTNGLSPGRFMDSITLPDAIRVLDNLINTGEVDWSIIDFGDTASEKKS